VAATAAAPGAVSVPAASESATQLTVFNRPVYRFRATLSGVSAGDRASRARARIQELLERPGANQVGQVNEGDHVLLQIDGETAFVVSPLDLDPGRDATVQSVAQLAASALQTAIAESQESRNLDTLLHAAARALAATVLLWLLVRLAAWLRGRVAHRFAGLTQRHALRLELGGLKPLQSERVVLLGRMLLTGVHRLFLFLWPTTG
jgi:hypothetical protein